MILSVWIMLEKRAPLATVSWILALAAFPGLGFVIYFLLGPRRLRRRRRLRGEARRRVIASLPRVLLDRSGAVRERVPTRSRQVMTLALNNADSPLHGGNRVRLLRNGNECYAAMEAAIAAARHHVHLEYYIFAPDRVGTHFLNLLARRASEGVQVRVLVDAVGSFALRGRALQPLLKAGGRVVSFNPATLARLRMNLRNHRKIVVCDGSVGFTGGLNIANEYAGLDPDLGPIRDTHLEIRGPAVHALQMVFLEDWNFATGGSVTGTEYFAEDGQAGPGDDSLVQIVASGPDDDWPVIRQVYFTAIASAKERIRATTPYFVPDESVLSAFVTAAMRGVDVKLLVPRRSDSAVITAAARSYFDDLLRAGVRVFEYRPGFLHAKTLTVDGILSSVGSANLDCRSFHYNYEVNAIVFGQDTARALEGMFDEDLKDAREVTLADRSRRRFHRRLAEAGARLLSPLL